MAELAAGAVVLRNQINSRWPGRDKRSDGWVGDRAHQNRNSDHNPDKKGIVHAIDVDENLGRGKWRNGRMAKAFAGQLIDYAASGLPGSDRVKYVVYENRIASGTYRSTWWRWRGSGYGHTAHVHISFTAKADKDVSLWPLPCLTKKPALRKKWAADLKKGK